MTEAVHISPEATPIWTIYPNVKKHGGQVPGIWTQQQVKAWRGVTAAVHRQQGYIGCQLLHAGRVAQPDIGQHPLIKDRDWPLPPVSSSAVPIEASNEQGNQYNWDQPATLPRALSIGEIHRVIGDYQQAAKNALAAGFDYVELHAAHGYLMEQFLADGVNQREDEYGGSVQNRCKFLFQTIKAIIDVVGPSRLGVRLSPIYTELESGKPSQVYFGVTDSAPDKLYAYAIDHLNNYPLAYLLLTEPRVGGLSQHPGEEQAYYHPLRNLSYRDAYRGTLIGAGGFTPASATKAVEQKAYDLIAFGRWFISNPDLPQRLKQGDDLSVYQRATFYGGDECGYTDYPEASRLETSRYALMKQADIGVSLNRRRSNHD